MRKQYLVPHETSRRGFIIKAGGSLPDDALLIAADITIDDYTKIMDVGSAQNGVDYFVYTTQNPNTLTWNVVTSISSIRPTVDASLKVVKLGGFHTLCVDAGTMPDVVFTGTGGIAHPLNNYVAGDILPCSLWDQNHKPSAADGNGMTYCAEEDIWVDIYLPNSIGTNTVSKFGAQVSTSRTPAAFVSDGLAVGKRLLSKQEFFSAAIGSPTGNNIFGSSLAAALHTGGHTTTNSVRILSHIGCEDCTGTLWQLVSEANNSVGTTDQPSGTSFGDVRSPAYITTAGGRYDTAQHTGIFCTSATGMGEVAVGVDTTARFCCAPSRKN